MIVAAGDAHGFGNQRSVAGGGAHPEDIMVAENVVNNPAVGHRGKDANDLVRLRAAVEDIAQHLDTVEKNIANGMAEMGNEPGRNDLFLKDRVRHRQSGQQPVDRIAEFRSEDFFASVAGIGQLVFENLDQAENNILSVHIYGLVFDEILCVE